MYWVSQNTWAFATFLIAMLSACSRSKHRCFWTENLWSCNLVFCTLFLEEQCIIMGKEGGLF